VELAIAVNNRLDAPLYRQVYDQLRSAILAGRLRPREKLPSTRELALRLELSRNTINLAYARLLSEGYLEARRGSGCFVSNLISRSADREPAARSAAPEPVGLAARARDLERWIYAVPSRSLPYDFRPGMPELGYFPATLWHRMAGRHLRRLSPELARYDSPSGYKPLRQAIVSYLRHSRAVACEAEQVVVTSGSQQALDLTARLLISPGQCVAVENPGYPAARAAFLAGGARLAPVAVDAEGIRVERIPRDARLVYVTPSHQYPTGVLLSLSRRLALLDWARKHRALVVEDDYDSEFRYGGRPVESLQGLDRSGRVLYVGTFSKVIFPTLRLGYVVLPRWLLKPFLAMKWIADRHTSGVEQRVLAEFMEDGYFERHLRRMSRVYRERREALISSLAQEAGDLVELVPSVAGLHLAVWLSRKIHPERLKTRAAELGVGLYPLDPYYFGRKGRPGLLFGYSGISTEEIRKGVRRLGQALRESGA
jgi:GntR family transcriptional regulator/MocR family aminotransferase